MSDTTAGFWAFSLHVWQNEALRCQLLALQERDDLDINLCLFLLWISILGLVLDDSESKITHVQGQWLDQTIKPIRALRMANQHRPQLKQALLTAELESEKCYQEALSQIRDTITRQTEAADNDKAATLKTNLKSYSQISWDSALINLMLEASQ